MAFPTDWGRDAPITIDHTKVAADATDFPLLLVAGNFNTESRDADGSYPALNGGGDLRFSSDEAGTTQLPCEVVSFVTNNDPALATAEVYVKVASVSSSTDTVIYVWYNKAGETQPAVTDTYGRNNVWESNYKCVLHMTDGTTTIVYDSTSNGNNGTKASANNPNSDTGKVGEAQYFSGGATDYLILPNDAFTALNTGSVQSWLKVNSTTTIYHPWGTGATVNLIFGHLNDNKPYIQTYASPANAYKTTSTLGSGFGHICWRSSGTAWSAFMNGGSAETLSAIVGSNSGDWYADLGTGADVSYIGRSTYAGYYLNGWIDEWRISATQFSEQRNNTDYQNQNAPTTFSTPGSGTTPGATTAIKDLICNGFIPFAR